jgi:hypothetical protein
MGESNGRNDNDERLTRIERLLAQLNTEMTELKRLTTVVAVGKPLLAKTAQRTRQKKR